MSAEKKPDIEDEIDGLLELFPEENREKLLSRIEHLTHSEQVAVLQYGLKKRKETLAVPPYKSERLRVIGKISDGIFAKALDMSRESVEVGRGKNGFVFEFENMESGDGTVVYKMLHRAPMNYQNDLLSEGAYQADVAAFADEHPELRVGVPHPFYIAATMKGYALAMEKIPGHSIEEIMEKNIRLPDDFDYSGLQQRLEGFVAAMNAEGFYHRDLREGNIMVDPEGYTKGSPAAYIIDFGLCTRAGSAMEAYSTVDGLRDHVIIAAVMGSLKDKQAQLRAEVSL